VLSIVSASAKLAGVVCETLHVEQEHIYQAIIDAASARRCDLIVMGSHGRRGLSAVVLSRETVKVLTHSKIPVLVYRCRCALTFTASSCIAHSSSGIEPVKDNCVLARMRRTSPHKPTESRALINNTD
jgi:hypothetical protein